MRKLAVTILCIAFVSPCAAQTVAAGPVGNARAAIQIGEAACPAQYRVAPARAHMWRASTAGDQWLVQLGPYGVPGSVTVLVAKQDGTVSKCRRWYYNTFTP